MKLLLSVEIEKPDGEPFGHEFAWACMQAVAKLGGHVRHASTRTISKRGPITEASSVPPPPVEASEVQA